MVCVGIFFEMGCGSFDGGCRRILLRFVWTFWSRLWEYFGVGCVGILVYNVGNFWCGLWKNFDVGFGVGCEGIFS